MLISSNIKFDFLNTDYLFDSTPLCKFSNSIYYKNHKSNNFFLTLAVLSILKEKYHRKPLFLLLLAVNHGRHSIITTKIKISGKIHNIPIPIKLNKQYSKLLKNLAKYIKTKRISQSYKILYEEILHLLGGTKGFVESINDKIDETAIDELPFAHYRWRNP